MKHRHLAIVGGINSTTLAALCGLGGAVIMTNSANASYQGLSATAQLATGGRISYRIYAVCTDPNDYITEVSGSSVSHLTIRSIINLGTGAPGSNFFNPPGGGATAPTAYAISQNPQVADDSFVTIGVSVADQAPPPGDQTMLFGSFAGIPDGNFVDTGGGGWRLPGPIEQGRAGFAGDGDPILRVLLMQLTVSSTSAVFGKINIAGVNNTALSGQQSFLFTGQTFLAGTTTPPSPGALPLLGLSFGLYPGRRRRG